MTVQATPIEDPSRVWYNANGGRESRPILVGKDAKPSFDSIPVIDVSAATSSSYAQRKALSDKIGHAAREVGFFYCVNHPISAEVIDAAFEAVHRFFTSPTDEKMKVHCNKSTAARGWEPVHSVFQDGTNRTPGDYKETFVLGDDYTDVEQQEIRLPDDGATPMNLWPDQPGFRKALCDYYMGCYRFSKALIRIYALALGLEEDGLDQYFTQPVVGQNSMFYPPQKRSTTAGSIGLNAHADHSAFSLVMQAGVPALEVLNHNGFWVKAPAMKHAFVANVGDYLQTMTNGQFQSTVHRVVNETDSERISLPFFLSPDPSAIIDVLPPFRIEGEPRKFEAVEIGKMNVHRTLDNKVFHPASIRLKESGIEYKDYRYEMLQGKF